MNPSPSPPARPRPGAPRIHPATRWHRLLGIACTLVVLVTVGTGLLLNHGDALGLSRSHPRNLLVDRLYRQGGAALPGAFATPSGWVSQLGAQVYLDARPLASHDAALVGAAATAAGLVLAYADGLVQYDDQGQVLETFGKLDGLALPLTRLGSAGGTLAVETAAGVAGFDAQAGTIGAAPVTAPVWVAPAAVPAALAAQLAASYRGAGVSWERVLLDLHSGRLFGRGGVLVVDLAAVSLLVVALTGVYMFFKFKRGGPRRAPAAKTPI